MTINKLLIRTNQVHSMLFVLGLFKTDLGLVFFKCFFEQITKVSELTEHYRKFSAKDVKTG